MLSLWILLASALTIPQPVAAASAPARVIITGKATSFIQKSSAKAEIKAGEDVEKKLAEALRQISATSFKITPSAGMIVALPADQFKLKDAAGFLNGMVAVEGLLTTTDDTVLMAVAGANGAKRVPMLIAAKATPITTANKAEFPAENAIICEVVVVAAEGKAASPAEAWAIRNGDGQVRFTLPKDAAPPTAGIRVRVAGQIRIGAGQLRIEAAKVEALTGS